MDQQAVLRPSQGKQPEFSEHPGLRIRACASAGAGGQLRCHERQRRPVMRLARLFTAAAMIDVFGCGGTYTVTGPDANTSLEPVARRITGERADISTAGTGEERVRVLSISMGSPRHSRSDPDTVVAPAMEQVFRIRPPAPVGSKVGGAIAQAADPPSRTLSLSVPKKERSSLPGFALLAGVLAGTRNAHPRGK